MYMAIDLIGPNIHTYICVCVCVCVCVCAPVCSCVNACFEGWGSLMWILWFKLMNIFSKADAAISRADYASWGFSL